MSSQPPTKSPLHDFPLPSLKWNTKKDRRFPPPSPSSSPTPFPVGSRSSRNRIPPTPAEPEPEREPEPEPEEAERQWNLRPRRKTGTTNPSTAETTVVDYNTADRVEKSIRTSNGDDQKRFWIALSKEEIEEDIYAMTGARPSRRPKKHSKIVQKQLDSVFPGLWLVGFSPCSYRHFVPPARK